MYVNVRESHLNYIFYAIHTLPGYAMKRVACNFVGNEAKGRISKLVFQENKVRQISRKTNIILTSCYAQFNRIHEKALRSDLSTEK